MASNLALFTLAGKGISPWLKVRSSGLFGQPVHTAVGAFWWTLALLMLCVLVAGFIRPNPGRRTPKEDP